MAEEKKEFPWIQLIATVGTILAALIGITPYLLKLNTPSAPQTPTIVIVTLPPAATPAAPVTTAPVTTTGVETTAPTQTTAATTVTTTGPPPGPAINIAANTSSVPQGSYILVSGSTTPAVPQVTITLTNSSGFRSVAVPVPLKQGAFDVQIGTSDYAPGDYTITAAVPDTQAMATASFTITAVGTPAPTTAATTIPSTAAATTVPATTAPTTVATTIPANTTVTAVVTTIPATNATTAATTVPANTTTTV